MRLKRKLHLCTLLMVVLSLTTNLSAETATPAAPVVSGEDSRALLKQVAEKSILPIYQEFTEASEQMHKDAAAFCESPTAAQLSELEDAWSKALNHWQQADSLLFGPAVEEQIDFAIYFLPAKKQLIKGALKQEGLPTIERLEKTGVGGQGFATIEYLLFDRDKTDGERLQLFVGEKGKQRCAYVQSASQLIVQHANAIYGAWKKGYTEAFSTAGKGSAEFIEANQPLEILVNKLFQTTEKVTSKKLAIPLDKKNEGKHVNAYKLEAWRSGQSLLNIQANVKGIERILVDGGITEWLSQHKQKALAEKLEKQLEILQKMTFTSSDLFNLITENEKVAEDFYQQNKLLTGMIKRELAPALGVQLGFNDNDGD